MKSEITYHFGGLTMKLDAMKVVFIPSLSVLLLSDIHLGKLTHFRRKGIPLPQKGEIDNLKRLGLLIEKYKPTEIMVIGDLFHSEYNSMWRLWLEFFHTYSQSNFHLIGGNHDILPSELYKNSGMILHDTLQLTDEIMLSHFPLDSDGHHICGHIHPGINVRLSKVMHKTLPCFYVEKSQMILPSFGTFTGSARMTSKSAQYFVTTGTHVFALG